MQPQPEHGSAHRAGDPRRPAGAAEADRLLATYLRDHAAGAATGLALARRCRRENAGTALEGTLVEIETEIAEDRRSLLDIMSRLGMSPSRLKSALGSLAELVGRLKSNGLLLRYSPSSRVVELEGLMAGVVAKRALWRTLRSIAADRAQLDAGELDRLIERATSQHERLAAAHDRTAPEAFATVT